MTPPASASSASKPTAVFMDGIGLCVLQTSAIAMTAEQHKLVRQLHTRWGVQRRPRPTAGLPAAAARRRCCCTDQSMQFTGRVVKYAVAANGPSCMRMLHACVRAATNDAKSRRWLQ